MGGVVARQKAFSLQQLQSTAHLFHLKLYSAPCIGICTSSALSFTKSLVFCVAHRHRMHRLSSPSPPSRICRASTNPKTQSPEQNLLFRVTQDLIFMQCTGTTSGWRELSGMSARDSGRKSSIPARVGGDGPWLLHDDASLICM